MPDVCVCRHPIRSCDGFEAALIFCSRAQNQFVYSLLRELDGTPDKDTDKGGLFALAATCLVLLYMQAHVVSFVSRLALLVS